jgi:hypothetical protein
VPGIFATLARRSFLQPALSPTVHLTDCSRARHTLVIRCDINPCFTFRAFVYLFYQPFGESVASRPSPVINGINLPKLLKKGSRVASYLVKIKHIKSQCEELGKANNIANIALKTARKEIKESDSRQQNIVKKYEEKIEELLAVKAAKVHEIKGLKKEKNKLNKKLSSFANSDTKPEA